MQAAGRDECLVIDEKRMLLGRLRPAPDVNPDALVEDVMELDPPTVRPDRTLESCVEQLHSERVASILVTAADMRLIGTLYLEDAEPRLKPYTEDAERRLDQEAQVLAAEDEPSCECGQ